MGKIPGKPPLAIVGAPPGLRADPQASPPQPPRRLGDTGMALWTRIQSEFRIQDAGGVELLTQACQAADRAEALADRVAEDGEVITTKGGPRAHPCIREELAARSFVVRTLERLGVTLEPVRPIGRPSRRIGSGGRDAD